MSDIAKDAPKPRLGTGANHSEHFGETVEETVPRAGDGKCVLFPRKLVGQGKRNG